ncbi:hypothetical protein MetMK1DRAFT_00000060 [Metallosphaera yellowstonensis MK1]|uniref:Archaeal flagellin-like protein n=1 Tax=Metallosphaera yellowstonensis MK1 TaxID=671065 RepID=H2C0D6_9CREN|nr:hypothetical protein [Metallosphaera yellowstonensis]EHP71335.1 hypothetical protein MetMK1DRAFT_00000060 [Metallosphaera yellowstonensis MK1]
MRKSKGLGTVIGTVIFLLIALTVMGTLLLISFREQAFSLQLSQAQTLMSEKNAESLSVQVINNQQGQGNNNQQGQGNGQATIQAQICIKNQGTVSSYVEYVVIVPVNNNDQISGPPIQVIGANSIPNPIPPGGTALVTLNLANNPNNNIGVLVVTAYGNVFQGGQLGG